MVPDDQPIRTPRSVAFYCWAVYSTWTAWLDLIDEWLKVKGDREKLKTFTNTILGEVWVDEGSGWSGRHSMPAARTTRRCRRKRLS